MKYEILGFHQTPVRVRFGEVDRYGYAWHGHALSYFEVARADLARVFELSTAQLLADGLAVPMVKLGCAYTSPAYEDELLLVQSTLAKPVVRFPMMRFVYRVIKAESKQEVLRGWTEQLVIRQNGMALTRLPEPAMAKLSKGWDYLNGCPRWEDPSFADGAG